MKTFFFTFIVLNLMFTYFFISHVSAVDEMKVYRNREYQFSIEIPAYFQYSTPRGPNVKMTAGIRDFNMNIVIKPVPEIENSTDAVLTALYMNDLELSKSNAMNIVESGIINIPHIRVLYECYLARYDYPRETFFLVGYSFQFIRHQQLYCITYCVEPGKENLYKDVIINSIGTFVDETGWY